MDLRRIPVNKIDRNRENPRLVFRQEELEQLLESINLYDVQVPIAVYRDGDRFVLIDGERRWRCALKLNHKTIPAIVQDRPDDLHNLLLMFNIHSLREQWDLLTIAMKLPRMIELITKQNGGNEPKEQELAEATGLPRAVIRRSKFLLALPPNYHDMILDELRKPKAQQRLSEDLFIEIEKALKTVGSSMPDLMPDKDRVRRVLLDKYKKGTIKNIVEFRKIGKIARAKVIEADPVRAHEALQSLFQPNDYSIDSAFEQSVSEAYFERDLVGRIDSLTQKLGQLEGDDIDDDLREQIQRLIVVATNLLESAF
ncbi:MAG: ParB family transcriptional regulator, chromosome partitioning protein [Thermoanaerobaculia bacterium]|nr:ParB family transcriptional regulator, chromosome partitioning protein [Thermoanaerobaculia bacterium]